MHIPIITSGIQCRARMNEAETAFKQLAVAKLISGFTVISCWKTKFMGPLTWIKSTEYSGSYHCGMGIWEIGDLINSKAVWVVSLPHSTELS